MKHLFATTCLLLTLLTAHADEEKRHVLALYDDQINNMLEPNLTDIHQMLEMPLNQLGLVVTYHNVNDRPLPDSSNYRGILIWTYRPAVRQPVKYIDWLSEALSNDVRLVVINGFGAHTDWKAMRFPKRNTTTCCTALTCSPTMKSMIA